MIGGREIVSLKLFGPSYAFANRSRKVRAMARRSTGLSKIQSRSFVGGQAIASSCPNQSEFEMAHLYLRRAFSSP